MEYTAPHTPQMNGVVERRISVLLNGARAAMYAANLTDDARKKLWAEAVRYTEVVRCSMATSKNVTSSNEQFFGKKPHFLHYMREFGRVGYVTKREKILNKLEERAIKCIFVGYGSNHSGDTYRMYNPETKRTVLTRDVKWAEFKKIDPKDNMDAFIKYDSTDIIPGIDELVIEVKQVEDIDKAEIHVIPDDEKYKNINVIESDLMGEKETKFENRTKLER